MGRGLGIGDGILVGRGVGNIGVGTRVTIGVGVLTGAIVGPGVGKGVLVGRGVLGGDMVLIGVKGHSGVLVIGGLVGRFVVGGGVTVDTIGVTPGVEGGVFSLSPPPNATTSGFRAGVIFPPILEIAGAATIKTRASMSAYSTNACPLFILILLFVQSTWLLSNQPVYYKLYRCICLFYYTQSG